MGVKSVIRLGISLKLFGPASCLCAAGQNDNHVISVADVCAQTHNVKLGFIVDFDQET